MNTPSFGSAMRRSRSPMPERKPYGVVSGRNGEARNQITDSLRNQRSASTRSYQSMHCESTSDCVPDEDVQHNSDDVNTPLLYVNRLTSIGGQSNASCNSYYTPCMEDRMRRKLRYLFMTPCEKWHARKRFPWKLVLQLLKVLFVTIQLTMFGYDRAAHVTFLEKNTIAFKHLYLKHWDSSHETMPYPPAVGALAVYTIEDLYDRINYALTRYKETETLAIGSYNFASGDGNMPPAKLCIAFFKQGKIFAFNETYIFDSDTSEDCYHIAPINNGSAYVYDVKKFLNDSVNFDSIVNITLHFSIKTIHLKGKGPLDEPDCFQFNITILYDNSGHNGQVLIDLRNKIEVLECNNKSIFVNDIKDNSALIGFAAFDGFVILLSVLSSILCIRSMWRGQALKFETIEFFKLHFDQDLSVYDKLEFLNVWYVMIVINDILTIIGSVYKIAIELKTEVFDNYEICSIMLGTGNLLVWFGVLRYLGFFEKYNILVLTMKRAAPNILRFLVCAMVFYFGFTFCGWVVLGPYHVKFRSLSSSSECLFSLVNGDDMFVTFSVIGNNQDQVIWYYSRIFLYIFISLFIYVVLSLFIAVIMDTYETIKYYYENGFPKSDLHQFISQCTDDPRETSHLYLSDSRSCSSCWNMFCCRKGLNRYGSEEVNTQYTSLIR